MQTYNDSLEIYKDHFRKFIQKIQGLLLKTNTDLKKYLDEQLEIIEKENDPQNVTANYQYHLFHKIFQQKNSKFSESCLYYIEKLISFKLLDGNCRDFVFYLNPQLNINDKQQRLLSQTIIDDICECEMLKDESVNVQMIKALITLMTSDRTQIHKTSILQVLQTLINIYTGYKSQMITNSARHALSYIIKKYYNKMEQLTPLTEEEKKILIRKKLIGRQPHAGAQSDQSLLTSAPAQALSQLSLSEKSQSPEKQISAAGLDDDIKTSLSANKTDQPAGQQLPPDASPHSLKTYVELTMKNIVDYVCIYDYKISEIEKSAEQIQSPEERDAYIKKHVSQTPVACVPSSLSDAKNPNSNQIFKSVPLKNELDHPAGKHGWCFCCRKTTNSYCKDTLQPICSKECKWKNFELQQKASEEIFAREEHAPPENTSLSDGIEIFRYICRCAQDQASFQQHQPGSQQNRLKQKLLLLEIITQVFDNAGPVFLVKKDFVQIIKEELIDNLLKNCLSSEQQIYELSFGIVVSLISNFRDSFRQEIGMFIENVFLKLLESKNSEFNNRLYALYVFKKLFKQPKAILELYANYDCIVKQLNIFEKIIDMIAKIAQGKYMKIEYQSGLTQQQQLKLKYDALDSLRELVKQLSDYSDQFHSAQGKVTAAPSGKGAGKEEKKDQEEEDEKELSQLEIENVSSTDEVERQRQIKLNCQKCIQKFNYKPELGYKHFVQAKLVEDQNSVQFAEILQDNHAQFNLEKLGEFFGSPKEFNQKVLSDFTDMLDFAGLNIENSLRKYLTYFQLPVEAQEVDRILQKFGQKFISDNPNPGFSASTAYTLSYAIMMLQTSLHNPQVHANERMKPSDFINMTKKINDGTDLPQQQILDIYTNIQKEPLARHMLDIVNKAKEDAINMSASEKKEQFEKEKDQLIKKITQQFKQSQDKPTVKIDETNYYQISSSEFITPVMQLIWSHLYGSFSIAIEETNDNLEILDISFQGILYSIKLLGQCKLVTEKDTFILFLIKETSLNDEKKQLKEKNICSINCLLQTSIVCGNYLQARWKQVLECISKLDNLYVIGSRTRRDVELLEEGARRNSRDDMLEQVNSAIVMKHIEQGNIDKVFHMSTYLDPDNILIFIQCLCELSEQEVKDDNNPRVFSIQRIQEVTTFNMDRVQFMWNKIWEILKQHFNLIGLHKNRQIAEISIDLLKQLSYKFLMKPELYHYHYQMDFLSPFEYIFQNLKSDNIEQKELILTCLKFISVQCYPYLKSGWKTILRIVNLSLVEKNSSFPSIAFKIVSQIMSQKLDNVKDVMIELMQALLNLSNNQDEKMSILTIDYLYMCIDFLAQNAQKEREQVSLQGQEQPQKPADQQGNPDIQPLSQLQSAVTKSKLKSSHVQTEYQKQLDSIWIQVLSALSISFNNDSVSIQRKCIIVLFNILKKYGQFFNREFWKMIFRSVLRPLFDELQFSLSQKNKSNEDIYYQVQKNAQSAFQSVIDIFLEYFQVINHCIKDFFDIIESCLGTASESLTRLGAGSIKDFLKKVGVKFSKDDWSCFIEHYKKIFQNSIPVQLLQIQKQHEDFSKPLQEVLKNDIYKKNYNISNVNFQDTIQQCVLHSQLINVSQEILDSFASDISKEHFEIILEILKVSYENSQEFDKLVLMRFILWKKGFLSDMKRLPSLLKHESQTIRCILQIYYLIYQKFQDPAQLQQFLDESLKFLQQFLNTQANFLSALKDDYEKSHKRKKSTELKQSLSPNLGGGDIHANEPSQLAQQGQLAEKTDALNLQIQQSYQTEMDKIINQQREIIASLILNLFNQITAEQFGQNIHRVVSLLTELSAYSYTRSMQCLTCSHCKQCNTCNLFSPDQFSPQITQVLKKIYTYLINKAGIN